MTVQANHIEKPEKKFTVSFMRAPYFNVYFFPEEKMIVTILAETEQGALGIAQYHWCFGKDFRLVGEQCLNGL